MAKIAVIGGGASGTLAAAFSSKKGHSVILFEKNEKLGKKLYITGKGRCNVTNFRAPREFLDNVVTNPKFLISCINGFPPEQLMQLFEDEGVPLVVERGERVFPASGKSSDIIRALGTLCAHGKVDIRLSTTVNKIEKINDEFIVFSDKGAERVDKVIIATGGVSYPLTGSTGDGYDFARAFGHTIVKPKPSLCPIILYDNVKPLEGLSLKNVRLFIQKEGNTLATEFGEMLFTACGVSGPIVLSASASINKCDLRGAILTVDLKPALSSEQLDARLLRDFDENVNKEFKNALPALLPAKLVPYFIAKCGISGDTKVHQITADNRKKIGFLLKNLSFSVKSLDKIDVAVVTSGGVNVAEVNPKTMESKLVSGLYFTGEVLDVDALTGGFNLQIAFSTAVAAAKSID